MNPVTALKVVVFPAPFGPDQADDLLRGNRKIDLIDGSQTAEPHREAADVQEIASWRLLPQSQELDQIIQNAPWA